jgi:hypothetical protein
MKLTERPEWGSWVTPKLLRQRPIYNWYVYPHSYDKELVLTLLRRFQIGADDWVWDPFVGAGTTLLACEEYGCSSIGSDILPLSVLVSKCKTHSYNRNQIAQRINSLSFEAPRGTVDRFAPIAIVKKALNGYRRQQISHLLNQIEGFPSSDRLFFQIVLIRSMADLAFAVKGGGWLRIDPERELKGLSFKSVFTNHATAMLNDLAIDAGDPGKTKPTIKVKVADARTATMQQDISACITSPPYVNRHDYTRVFALELALLSVSSAEELISLRYKTLRSHVEAKPLRRANVPPEKIPSSVSRTIARIDASGSNDRRIPQMIRGYFEDMFLVMQNIANNLKPNGYVALVVGNTQFSGVMIPVDQILASIGKSVGLIPEEIIVARWRGNSAQQMGTYGRSPARESVVILKNKN